MPILSYIKFTIISTLFLGVFIVNQFLIQSSAIGFLLMLVYFGAFGAMIGKSALPSEKGWIRTMIGSWIIISFIMIIGSVTYYVFALPPLFFVILVLLTPSLVWFFAKHKSKTKTHDPIEGEKHHVPWTSWLSASILILLGTVAGIVMSQSATFESVRSPWVVIPLAVLLIFGLMVFTLLPLLFRGRERALLLALFSIVLFVFLSVTFFSFPLGYGFDTFIHQATETHIAETGTITPKPFYYIGQYSFVLFLHHNFFLPIRAIDPILILALVATLLPAAWLLAASHLLQKKSLATASLIGIFFLPLAGFIVTTPQAIANLWTLMVLLLAVPRLVMHKKCPIWPLILGGITTALIHPIAGIPIILFLILLLTNDPETQKYPRITKGVSIATIILGSVLLPLAFITNAFISKQDILLQLKSIGSINILNIFKNGFHPTLDIAYLFQQNLTLIILLLSFLGAFYFWKKTKSELFIFPTVALMIFINFIIMKQAVEFSFLIDYERSNYTDRLIPISLFFLSPFLILFFGKLSETIRRKSIALQFFTVAFLAIAITSLFYTTYPRVDAYERSHGFNMGQTDIEAVQSIEHVSEEEPYIVLANQNVSAASIREYGFNKYYNGHFYYPVPTGGPLYELFLQMNDGPSKEIAIQAMDLAEVDKLYYVVNEYWWQADRIREQAKTSADEFWTTQDEHISVFQFNR